MKAAAMVRRYAKYAGYPVFFLLCFWLSLSVTFPLERFLPALEQKAGEALGREVRIGEVSLSPLGRLVFSSVTIGIPGEEPERAGGARDGTGGPADDVGGTDDPGSAGGKETADGKRAALRPEYLIDEVVVNLGIIALLFDELDLEVGFDGLGGEIRFAYAGPLPGSEPEQPERGPRGRIRRGARGAGAAGTPGAAAAAEPGAEQPDAEEQAGEGAGEAAGGADLLLTVEASGIDLALVHDLRAKLPLPMTGTLDFAVRLASETGRFADAAGEMTLRVAQAVLGAENAQIDAGGMPLTIDPIQLTAIDCRVAVSEGTAEFEAFETKSSDFDLQVKGTVTLGDPLKRSRFDIYLMFKFLEGYTGKSEKAEMLVSNIDQFSRDFKLAHRDDGYWGFRYRGIFGASRFSPSKLAPGEHGQKASKRADRLRGAKAARGRAGANNLPSGPTGPAGLASPAGGGMQDLQDSERSARPEPEPERPPLIEEAPPPPEPGGEGKAGEEPSEAEAKPEAEEAPEEVPAEEAPENEAPAEDSPVGGGAGSTDGEQVE